jgi:hypothetical protein
MFLFFFLSYTDMHTDVLESCNTENICRRVIWKWQQTEVTTTFNQTKYTKLKNVGKTRCNNFPYYGMESKINYSRKLKINFKNVIRVWSIIYETRLVCASLAAGRSPFAPLRSASCNGTTSISPPAFPSLSLAFCIIKQSAYRDRAIQ